VASPPSREVIGIKDRLQNSHTHTHATKKVAEGKDMEGGEERRPTREKIR